MTKTVVGHFSDSGVAQSAVSDLEQDGFTSDEVSYVATDGSGRFGDISEKPSVGSGAGKGAAAGGASGLLVGLAAMAIPGIGPVLAAGPIAVAITGAGIGAAVGGMLGALADLEVPERDRERWEKAIRHGGTLVLVRTGEDKVSRAASIIQAHGPVEMTEHELLAREGSGFTPGDPHTDAPNYGEEGGSSQWRETVLGADGIRKRTVNRETDKNRRT